MKKIQKIVIILIFSFLIVSNTYLVFKVSLMDSKMTNMNLYIGNNKVNSPKRLLLKSTYGDNQAYHPKVLSFKEKWNGYKYWMSFSPYPYADAMKENPHIKVSNDLINWTDIDEKVNPLDTIKNSENGKKYNSDPHLVYNSTTDTLECWWRYVDSIKNKVTIYRRTTKDGKTWSKKESIFTSNRDVLDWISPSIIYEDNIYKIWYVYKTKVYYTESYDLKKFSDAKMFNIEYEDSVKTWHIDVIHTEKGYEMIIVAFSDWNHRAYMNLYYTFSKDNNIYSTADVIMKPTTGTNYWDNSGLYRSSFIYENDKYYVFYSGQGTNFAKGIGLMSGKDIYNLKSVI